MNCMKKQKYINEERMVMLRMCVAMKNQLNKSWDIYVWHSCDLW